MRVRATFVAVLVALGSSCSNPTSTQELPPGYEQVIYAEWPLAQEALICLGYYKAGTIPPTLFDWEVHEQGFPCGESTQANGCFSSSKMLIEFNSRTPTAIRHEAGHAILWALNKRSVWKCFEHPLDEECPVELNYPFSCERETK